MELVLTLNSCHDQTVNKKTLNDPITRTRKTLRSLGFSFSGADAHFSGSLASSIQDFLLAKLSRAYDSSVSVQRIFKDYFLGWDAW